MTTRCHICDRPCVYEISPAVGDLPAEVEADVWQVAMDNGFFVDACHACWFKWPSSHKRFQGPGWARWEPDEEQAGGPDELIDVWSGSPVPLWKGWS